MHLGSGQSLQSEGSAIEPYASVDEALDRLEKQLRRSKRRLKNHHAGVRDSGGGLAEVEDSVRQDERTDVNEPELAPAIIAETQTSVLELSVGDAVIEMDSAEKVFLIFKNASNGRVNVVYRRGDGNIGWIDPGGVSALSADR